MNQSNIILRKGTKEDIPSIMELVMELAIFENAESEMVATKEMYEDTIDEGIYDLIVATVGDQIVGMMLFYYGFSTWKGKMLYLEDFVVSSNNRSLGIGQLLFDKMIEEAKDKKCALIKWQVLDWNKDAIRFYKKQNATIETEWYNGKILF